MLTKLTVKNFQRHKKFALELDPHITTLIGVSDAGKSALVRALRWLCTNRPKGGMPRHGSASSEVTLEVDGHTVTRKKGEENVYLLDGQRYVSFGAGVPDDVSKLLNLGPVNFQGQMDPPWFLSLSPGEVSRELNEVINLDLIDTTLANLASDLRAAKVTVEVCRTRLRGAKEQVENLSWTVEAMEELEKIDKLQADHEHKRTQCLKLAALVEEGSNLRREARNAQNAALDAANLLSSAEDVREKETRMGFLRRLIGQARETYEDTAPKIAYKEVKKLESALLKMQRGQAAADKLRGLIGEWQRCENEVCLAAGAVRDAKVRYREARGGRCPTCGRMMTTR